MILVNSNSHDIATFEVLRWLRYRTQNYKRINDSDNLFFNSIEINNCNSNVIFRTNSEKIELSSLKSFWYRRGALNFQLKNINNSESKFSQELNNYFNTEYDVIENYIAHNLQSTSTAIGDIRNNHTNKLINLEIARSVKLAIPDSLVTTSKSELINFYNKHLQNGNAIVTKTINVPFQIFEGNNGYAFFTSIINKLNLIKVGNTFFSTLYQEQISKKFELRIFFLAGEFYSTAIFSQGDKQTKVDFRNYNYQRPNRTPPFRLPLELKKKLTHFMKLLNMNCGSIDMIYSVNKEYVFLEVNPVGQYSQVSLPANYFLHEKIAKHLMHEK